MPTHTTVGGGAYGVSSHSTVVQSQTQTANQCRLRCAHSSDLYASPVHTRLLGTLASSKDDSPLAPKYADNTLQLNRAFCCSHPYDRTARVVLLACFPRCSLRTCHAVTPKQQSRIQRILPPNIPHTRPTLPPSTHSSRVGLGLFSSPHLISTPNVGATYRKRTKQPHPVADFKLPLISTQPRIRLSLND